MVLLLMISVRQVFQIKELLPPALEVKPEPLTSRMNPEIGCKKDLFEFFNHTSRIPLAISECRHHDTKLPWHIGLV